MELLTLLSAFCVALFLLLPHSQSVQLNMLESPQHGNHAVLRDKFTVPPVSRKMKLEATNKAFADKDLMPQKLIKDSSGEKVDEKDETVRKHEASRKAAKEAERIEAANYYKSTVEDFTMDYRGVRKRRPIHNKDVPNSVP